MANTDHLSFLKQGASAWNQFRKEHPSIYPDLSGANLAGWDLAGLDLSGANLTDVNLSQANLSKTLLMGANLAEANLLEANLAYAILKLANLNEIDGANIIADHTDFSHATLIKADLSHSTCT
ncbi:MAG: pentapeptide repeat-containing protein, partial [Nitrospirota bacterium]|nr:pentapeptide repeat-containing protein [Nitrospirota bacterium]